MADKIPNNALVVLLPEDDPPLCRRDPALARRHREKNQPVVHVGEKIGFPSKVSSGATPT